VSLMAGQQIRWRTMPGFIRFWMIGLHHEMDLVAHSRATRLTVRFVSISVLAIILAAYGTALWEAPNWLHAQGSQSEYYDRTLVLSAGTAIVVICGLLYTSRNYWLSRRGQVSDRFSQALERLGSQETFVRIGGINALSQIMHDSPRDQSDVVGVLTAFISCRVPRQIEPVDTRFYKIDPKVISANARTVEADVQACAARKYDATR
jgi:hypothetical protein